MCALGSVKRSSAPHPMCALGSVKRSSTPAPEAAKANCEFTYVSQSQIQPQPQPQPWSYSQPRSQPPNSLSLSLNHPQPVSVSAILSQCQSQPVSASAMITQEKILDPQSFYLWDPILFVLRVYFPFYWLQSFYLWDPSQSQSQPVSVSARLIHDILDPEALIFQAHSKNLWILYFFRLTFP